MKSKTYKISRNKGELRRSAALELLQKNSNKAMTKFVRNLANNELRTNSSAYLQKYGESISQSLKAVKRGDAGKIFQIIGWDKSFLSNPVIISRILVAEDSADKRFLLRLSQAIRRRDKPKIRNHDRLLTAIRGYVESGKYKNEKEVIKAAENIRVELCKRGYQPNDPSINLLEDIKEFPRWIRRNRVLIFRKIPELF